MYLIQADRAFHPVSYQHISHCKPQNLLSSSLPSTIRCLIVPPNAGSHLESPAEPQREMLPGLSEQDANRALAWFEGNDYNEEELDDEIEAFARSLAADWEVEHIPISHAVFLTASDDPRSKPITYFSCLLS